MFRSRWLRNVLEVTRSHKDRRRLTTRSYKPGCLVLEQLEDRITPSSFQTLYSFTGGSDGANPKGGVILDGSGNLYGTTALGGRGTLFEISSKGTSFTNLYSFTAASGNNPQDTPIRDSSGNLYGTTYVSGTGDGTVFEYSANGTYTTLHTFALGTDGAFPLAGLITDNKGDLFGTTTIDSSNGGGSVFELSPNGSGGYNFTTLYGFNTGFQIYSGLVMDSAGNLYGTTLTGGASNAGVAYKLSPDGSGGYTYSTLHTFTGGSDGGSPIGGLTLDGKGNLYGTTSAGGAGGTGTVFQLSTDGSSFTTLYSFDSKGAGGANPQDTLLLDSKGNLYGTTYNGGTSNDGVVFELSPNGNGGYTNTTLHTFVGSDGANPYAGLVTDGNGNLYGTTVNGGSNSDGTVFELTGVLPASTTTAASNASATFSPNAQNVTLTANVTSSSATVNEGTVTFTILQGSTVIGTATTSGTVSKGAASVSYALPGGAAADTYTIDAVYNPGSDFATSTDNTRTLSITPANVTTTAFNASAISSASSQTVTLSATVADTSIPGDTVGEGTVTFTVKNGPTAIGTSVQGTVKGSKASVDFSLPAGQAVGSYTIAVSYGDSPDNFTDSGDTSATLTVLLAPTVSANPADQTVMAGQTATFTAAANGNPSPTVQWQISHDSGKTWTDIGGATSTTLTLSNVSSSLDANEYRAVFTNSGGSVTTTAALLTVQTPPSFTSTNNVAFTVGQGGSFTVTAVGSPTPTVTESGTLPVGVAFTDDGNGTATLSGAPAAGTQGTYHFTLTAHNGVGSDATQSFTLSVNAAPVPSSPPPSPSGPSAPVSLHQPPTLNVPPLLALFDSLLAGIETINANNTETVTDSLFGSPLLVSTFDGSGNFVNATLFGVPMPNWIWFL